MRFSNVPQKVVLHLGDSAVTVDLKTAVLRVSEGAPSAIGSAPVVRGAEGRALAAEAMEWTRLKMTLLTLPRDSRPSEHTMDYVKGLSDAFGGCFTDVKRLADAGATVGDMLDFASTEWRNPTAARFIGKTSAVKEVTR